MALSRRGGQRMSASIWPGFVDAMTALLLVLMFVLSIFMIIQSVLRETIDTQGSELDALADQVAGL
ncbi:MAG: peptidoglycan-binding protein, partial [Paracoccaceae bacterium]|nr:peptidoglycan-binding protein [Paracoccaceae bacterium]